MKLNIRTILAGAALIGSMSAIAQHTVSGYFVDEYTYRFQMNPAMGNEKGFFAMPALGNINIGVQGNLHLTDILYKRDGSTVTFMHPGISASEVMGNLSNVNRIGSDINLTILAGGFKAWGGYNTISLNTRVTVGAKLPKSVFSLLKEGVQNQTYDISDMRVGGNSFVDLSFGHSHRLTDEWNVGANLKIILGAANIDARFKNARLTLGEDDWSIVSDAIVESSVKGLTYKTDINENTGKEYVSGADVNDPSINGFGLGLDLGAVYKPKALPDWEFSAALLDLGFIHWNNNVVASTQGEKSFNTDRYTFSVEDDSPNSFENQWDNIKDDLSALYELDDLGDQGGRTTGIGATLNLGAKYTLPMYNKLSFGLLNTTRINGAFGWTDFRLSANIAPAKALSGGINLGAGTFGCSFGWMVNLHVTGFNLFVGSDHLFGKLAKQGVPLSSNGQLNMGMNFLF